MEWFILLIYIQNIQSYDMKMTWKTGDLEDLSNMSTSVELCHLDFHSPPHEFEKISRFPDFQTVSESDKWIEVDLVSMMSLSAWSFCC